MGSPATHPAAEKAASQEFTSMNLRHLGFKRFAGPYSPRRDWRIAGTCPSLSNRESLLTSMSNLTYIVRQMGLKDKPLVWLHGEVKTPPFSKAARLEAGILLRQLQRGEQLSMPHSRPMPTIGRRCHELRINDEGSTWRLIYRTDRDAVVIVEVFKKKTTQTSSRVISRCRARLKEYDDA